MGTGLEALGTVIAALALFAAVMLVLSLATEVMIESVKILMGLKKKPTAMEALKEYSAQIPGKLSEIGISSEGTAYIENLSDSLKKNLQPAHDVSDITASIQAGEFLEAIEKANKLNQNTSRTPQKEIIKAFDHALVELCQKIKISPAISDQIRAGVKKTAEGVDPVELPNKILEYLGDETTLLVQGWLENNVKIMANQGLKAGRVEIEKKLENEVMPQLQAALGLSQAYSKGVLEQVDWALDLLNDEALSQLNYLDSIWELLQGVEQRRFEIQSPIRKLWRRLRGIPKVGKVFEGIERVFNALTGRTPPSGNLNAPWPVEKPTSRTLAKKLMLLENSHKDAEESRLRWMRVIAGIGGVTLAFLLQIDSFQILIEEAPIFEFLDRYNVEFDKNALISLINLSWLFGLFAMKTPITITIPAKMTITIGILISGLAASAGSAYWHDVLDRLQIMKSGVSEVEKIVESIQTTKEG